MSVFHTDVAVDYGRGSCNERMHKTRNKKAKVIATHSKLEAKDKINVKHSYFTARIDTITKQHKVSVEKIWDNFLIIQSYMQAEHKSILRDILAKYESKIGDLSQMIQEKTKEVKELKLSVKAVTELAATEKLELKGKHWQEKPKL